MINIGTAAWILTETNDSIFFRLHAENNGKIEVARMSAAPLSLCDWESFGGALDPSPELPEEGVARELIEERGTQIDSLGRLVRIPETLHVEQFRRGEWVDFAVALHILHISTDGMNILKALHETLLVPRENLLDELFSFDTKSGRRKFRPFTSEFGRLLLNHNFYRERL